MSEPAEGRRKITEGLGIVILVVVVVGGDVGKSTNPGIQMQQQNHTFFCKD